MGNPLFNALGGSQAQQGGPMNFVQFMMQNRGKDPEQLKQQMISSLNLNQSQLNQAQQMAKQVEGQLAGFKGMFGFK